MTLPETDLARIRRWLDAQNASVPPSAVDLVRNEIDIGPRSVTIVECRAPWREDLGPEWMRQEIARLRYTASRKEWMLYWSDSNSKFHLYDRVEPTPNVERLLAEIDDDPTCIFWG